MSAHHEASGARTSEQHPERHVLLAFRRVDLDGCGGRLGRVELLTGIDGVSSQPVRRIVLMG
jgi:hypothetical protein